MPDFFNHALFILVRQLMSWSQTDLATAVGITQAQVSKIENLSMLPSEDLLRNLADRTKFYASFFKQSGDIAMPTSVHPMYRKKEVVRTSVAVPKIKILEKVIAEASLRVFHLRQIPEVRQHLEAFLAISSAVTRPGSPTETARLLRRHLGLGEGPLNDLTSLAEKCGVIVYHCDFGDEAEDMVDGVSLMYPGLPPTVFLNKNRCTDRMRFSLAHELGHVFQLHTVPGEMMEQEANEFAAELLMPATSMMEIFSNPVQLDTLAALKPAWRVSIASLLYRASYLRAINPSHSSRLWREINLRGWRVREPLSLSLEPETPLLVSTLFDGPRYSLAEQLHIHPERLEAMYGVRA